MRHKTKESARVAAAALLKFFPKKRGWHIHLWENMGWHFCFETSRTDFVRIYHDDGEFNCLLGTSNGGKGNFTPDRMYRSKNPMVVLRKTMAYAEKSIVKDIDALNECGRALEGYYDQALRVRGEGLFMAKRRSK